MAADPFSASLSQQAYSPEMLRQLAEHLRGQAQLGGVLSLSGAAPVAALGQADIRQAQQMAQSVGQQQTRLKQALAEEEYRRQRLQQQQPRGYEDIQTYQDPNGGMVTMGLNKATGRYEQLPGTEGLTPYKPSVAGSGAGGGGGYHYKIKGPNGQDYIYDSARGFQSPRVKGWLPTLEDAMLADDAAMKRGYAAKEGEAVAYSKTYGAGRAKKFLAKTTELEENIASQQKSLPYYDQIIKNAPKAIVGPVTNYLPTLRQATAAVEHAVQNLSLENLKRVKLAPVSDKDIAFITSTTVPSYGPGDLKGWAEKRKEATKRMIRADQYMLKWRLRHGRDPGPDEMDEINKKVDEILHGGGFTFDYTPREPGIPVENIPLVGGAYNEIRSAVNSAANPQAAAAPAPALPLAPGGGSPSTPPPTADRSIPPGIAPEDWQAMSPEDQQYLKDVYSGKVP